MSIEVTPLGIACNLKCIYCYEHARRDADNHGAGSYNIEAMKKALLAEGGKFSVFGGEPLLVPLADLEKLWAFGKKNWGTNGLQTNGSLITDEHIKAFIRYNVHVGFSIDGPGELNDARWAGTLDKTRELTAKSLANLDRALALGLDCSLIVTLHRLNASRERLPMLLAWLHELDGKGLRNARVHVLEVDSDVVEESLALPVLEQIEALLALATAEAKLATLKFDLFREMRALLALDSKVQITCTWNSCDPYSTTAVRSIDGQGNRSNCGRMAKEGVQWCKADSAGHERQLALYHTPQEHGGCKGCRFFVLCRGNCPGTAINGDWRNRSAQCPVWMALFEKLEGEIKNPASRRPDLGQAEKALVRAWSSGRDLSAIAAFQAQRTTSACGCGPCGGGHGDSPHVDTPHGDSGRAR